MKQNKWSKAEIAARLKQERKSAGFTQAQVATALGSKQQTVASWESAQSQPDADTLFRLCALYGTSVDEMFDYAPQPNIPYDSNGANTPHMRRFKKYGLMPVETQKIPLLGEIACGEPIFADEDRESYVEVGTNIHADFCLRAKGDSMIGARIYDGDIVFIHQQSMVDNGEIAAVLIDDCATLKRVYYDKGKNKLVLSAENPSFAPLVYVGEELEDIRILGKAIAFQSDVR